MTFFSTDLAIRKKSLMKLEGRIPQVRFYVPWLPVMALVLSL
jgi:hypothetical protein